MFLVYQPERYTPLQAFDYQSTTVWNGTSVGPTPNLEAQLLSVDRVGCRLLKGDNVVAILRSANQIGTKLV